jgi:MPBQ/MSBQ methyltransferase
MGGSAGATAAALLARGDAVEIVVPSPVLAERCRANAPAAILHPVRFEAFEGDGPFDVLPFSESWQYIPQDVSFPSCARLRAPGGTLPIADCVRSDTAAR